MSAADELRQIMLQIGKLSERAAALIAAGGLPGMAEVPAPAVTQRAAAARSAAAQGQLFGSPVPMSAVTQKLGPPRTPSARQQRRALYYLHVWRKGAKARDRIWRVTHDDLPTANIIEAQAAEKGGESEHLTSREVQVLLDTKRREIVKGSTAFVGAMTIDDLSEPTPETVRLPWEK